MAEFCLDCLNKINKTNDSEDSYFLSKELLFCEECGQMKNIVICYRKKPFVHLFTGITSRLRLFIGDLKDR